MQFVKSRLDPHVRSTVTITRAEMLSHEAVDKDFVMPYSPAELFPDAQGDDGRSALIISRAIGASKAPPPPRSILHVGAAPVDPER